MSSCHTHHHHHILDPRTGTVLLHYETDQRRRRYLIATSQAQPGAGPSRSSLSTSPGSSHHHRCHRHQRQQRRQQQWQRAMRSCTSSTASCRQWLGRPRSRCRGGLERGQHLKHPPTSHGYPWGQRQRLKNRRRVCDQDIQSSDQSLSLPPLHMLSLLLVYRNRSCYPTQEVDGTRWIVPPGSAGQGCSRWKITGSECQEPRTRTKANEGDQ